MQAGGQEFESPHLHQFPYLDIASNTLDGSYRDKSGKQSGKQLLEAFIKDRKSTKGLTASGEEWLRETLTRFVDWVTIPLTNVTRDQIIQFLAIYDAKPWRKHSFYRSLRTFYRWISTTQGLPNPFIDRFGNRVIDPPNTPTNVLYTIDPDSVRRLMVACQDPRDTAMVALLADSGARRGEITSIWISDVDIFNRKIKVVGKGGKEGFLAFGGPTAVPIAPLSLPGPLFLFLL